MLNICNYYEQLVIDHLWQLTNNPANNFTQAFIEDVACLALNDLPTCYVRNLVDKGANMTEHDHQEMRQLVLVAIDKAMIKVLKHPHELRGE